MRTKTGVWKGASSGQSCSPSSNIRFPMMLALELSGKTAIVTGGSRGIGRAIAVALARQG